MNSTDVLNLVINELATHLTNASTSPIDHHHHPHTNHYPDINVTNIFKQLVNESTDHGHDDDHDHDHDDDHENNQTDIIIAKATAMAVLFCASTLCGCIPFLLNRRFKWTEKNTNARSATVVKCLLYFGGGVLLCTTFLHLLPEVKENIQTLQSKHVLPDFNFNFAELLMCLGFFAMFLVEEIIHTYIHRHNKDAQNATGAFVRGISITDSILVKRKSTSSTSSSSATTTSLTNKESIDEQKNSNGIKKNYASDDIEKNQTISNMIIDNLVEDSVNREKGIINTTNISSQEQQQQNPGIINHSYEHEQNLNSNIKNNIDQQHHHHDHIYKKKPVSRNSSFYNQVHENQQHNNQHHRDHQKAYNTNDSIHENNGHGHSHAHGHSHLPIGTLNEDHIVASLRGLLVVLALSVHELFEGLAVGLESKTDNVWYMFGAVSAHKLVLAFCVGVELIVTRTKLWLSITYVMTFAIVSPLGIGIGIFVSSYDNGTASAIPSAILQGLATGTLLYVVFFEILSKERSGLIPYASFVVGFIVMFGLQFATGHEHSHDHGHSHGDGAHGHNSKSHDSLNDDEIDYTKKSIQEQLEILRAAGKELLEKNHYQLHHLQHQNTNHDHHHQHHE